MRLIGLLCLLAAACGGDPSPELTPDAMPRPDAMECALTTADSTCCFDDDDCSKAADERCYTQTCVAGGEGRCEPDPPAGKCWSSDDCPSGQTCSGPQICPCGVRCLIEDSPGTCT